MSLDVVELLDRLLLDLYRIDVVDVRTSEALTEGGELGAFYRFDAHGVRHLWACGLMRPSGHPAEVPVPAVYIEAGICLLPSWDTLLLLERHAPGGASKRLEFLDQGEVVLGMSFLLALQDRTQLEVKETITSFLQSIEPTRAAIFSRYGDLRPIAVDTGQT